MRPRVLTRGRPPRLHAIVREAALRVVVGGPHVMRGRLPRPTSPC
ncbi:Scr1 family TA system antitoxin-like transcriptional regulator [Streptomyces sp. NPDC004542]